MLSRQKALLFLIDEMRNQNRPLHRTYIDKCLFVLKEEYHLDQSIKFYNFYPYQFGPFSNNFYYDLSDLQSKACLDEQYSLSSSAREAAGTLPDDCKTSIRSIVSRFKNTDAIKEHVYSSYPDYTVNSALDGKSVKKPLPARIFSIGYEKKDIDQFLNILVQNQIDILVDVRANPFSMNMAFIQSRLRRSLEKVGIEYLHLPQLGIAGEMRKKLETRADYDHLFAYYRANVLVDKDAELSQLLSLGKEKRIALLCFELNKEDCHRGVLSHRLEQLGAEPVIHL